MTPSGDPPDDVLGSPGDSGFAGAGDDATHRAVEFAARTSYGRLVAILAARSSDVASAEDALSDAFSAALSTWPLSGVPENAEGWLIAAARRRLLDGRRRADVRRTAAADLSYAADLLQHDAALAATGETGDGFPDRRLGLLFACAHPAIDVAVRTPLMLQVVLGFEARDIASAFLTSPTTMAQRLVRAKRKIRDAGIPFSVPEHHELPPRLDAVLDAIYAAFASGWDAVTGGDVVAIATTDYADEAIWLGRILVDLLPDEAEARGLLALMLYCHARRHARLSPDGAYVPLHRQDASRWSLSMIGEAERMLMQASRVGRVGRFQLEAAIQSAHLAPAFGRAADWPAITALHDALVAHAPTVGARVNRAAAIGESRGAEAGLSSCDEIPTHLIADYQPWWALRAHLLSCLKRNAESREAYERAAGLTRSLSLRSYLLAQLSACEALVD